MKSNIIKICAGAALLPMLVAVVGQAEAHTVVVTPAPVVVAPATVTVQYDAAGFPIWGYGPNGRAIYAYAPDGSPIYVISSIYRGCYVPTWDPRPTYRGPFWPGGIHRGYHPKHPHYHPVAPTPPRAVSINQYPPNDQKGICDCGVWI